MKFKKIIYVAVGCISVGLGTIGAVLPVLPTFPFFLLAAFCFAKSSKKLHTWFINTRLYQENLADYVAGNGMSKTTKIRIMLTVTILMAFGFAVMMQKHLYIPCMILGSVWAAHIVYFVFGVKTYKTAL